MQQVLAKHPWSVRHWCLGHYGGTKVSIQSMLMPWELAMKGGAEIEVF